MENKPVEYELPAEFYYHTYMYQNNLDLLESEPGQSGLLHVEKSCTVVVGPGS